MSELLIILPAIDIRGGRCVRLRQGDYAQETVFGENPVAVAEEFQKAGARWLHVVDLDGAREGELRNLNTIRAIVAAVSNTVAVEVGGGIRTTEAAETLLGMGIRRVVAGTRAVSDPTWLQEIAAKFPGKVALGIDARGAGEVRIQGWTQRTALKVADVFNQVRNLRLAAIIYTDIAQDGMMSGPNFVATQALAQVCPFDLIASGGVTTVDDIRRLKAAGAAGAIIGRALYEGKLTLEAALDAAGDHHV